MHASSTRRARWTPKVWGMSFIHKLYRVGDRTDPYGTPLVFLSGSRHFSFNRNSEFSVSKEIISLIMLAENFKENNFYKKPGCLLVSKAFSMSKNTAAVGINIEM
jgi:hypothetical protein